MKTRLIGLLMCCGLLAACETDSVSMNAAPHKTNFSQAKSEPAKATPTEDLAALTAKADKGEPWSQSRLASYYESGKHGLAKDEVRAAALYTQAANKGLAEAQSRLAGYYEKGRGGVPADPSKAFDLYLKAAQQGYGWAQYKVGTMYAAGQGAPSYPTEAAFWLTLAKDKKNGPAQAKEAWTAVTQKLTAAQIIEINQRAATWKPVVAAKKN